MLKRKEWLVSVLVAVGAFGLANGFEASLIRLTGGNPWDLAWISDVVLSCLVMTGTYLWLHVRNLRGAMTALERERLAFDTELRVAADIQRALLSRVRSSTGLLWHAVTQPAGRIGGDFYDLVAVGQDSVLILVADVSGKGVPAALGLASARSAFRMIAQSMDEPAAIASQWSSWLYADSGGEPYLTAILLRLDRRTRRLRYVNAGHPAGLVIAEEQTHRILPTGTPLGLLPDARVAAEEIDWPSGALGVLVTDGITEALDDGGDPVARLDQLVQPFRKQPPRMLCMNLLEALSAAENGVTERADDRTVVAFKTED